MKEKRKKWTPGEDLELKRYFTLGYTSAEIAEKLGRSKSAVDARKNKLGLADIKVSAKNPADVAQILKFTTRRLDTRENWQSFRCDARAYLLYFVWETAFVISVKRIRSTSDAKTRGQTANCLCCENVSRKDTPQLRFKRRGYRTVPVMRSIENGVK